MPITPDLPKTEVAIVELTNTFRREQKLGPMAAQPLLTKAAREYARFLAAAPVFSHEADGRRPADRIKAAGYDPCRSAENLAWMLDSRGFETLDLANRLVEGWKSSPPHRANLVLPHVTETGVAVVKVRNEEKYMAVQLLGRPAALKYQFAIENAADRAVSFVAVGEHQQVKPNQIIRYTACEPAEVAIDVKPGGLLTKPVVARFEARDGQVFRLTKDSGGAVKVEVGQGGR